MIALRFINIGMFAAGLILLRRVMLRIGASAALTNVSLLLFVLIPVSPQLAAQINYDNLLIPLVAWSCLLAFQAIDEIRRHRPSVRTIAILFSVCLLTSLVKYEFLPIFLAIVLFLAFTLHQSFRGKLSLFVKRLKQDWQAQSRRLQLALVALVVVSMAFFVQRDGVNLVKYHTISPNCAAVLSVNDCKAYSVWDHDYLSHQLIVNKVAKANPDPATYIVQWAYWLWYRLFFAINGPASQYTNYPPLPLPSAAFILIGIASLAAIFKWHRRIFDHNPYGMLVALIIILYLAALLAEGYLAYEYTDVLELMNGRYLLPVQPLCGRWQRAQYRFTQITTFKATVAVVAIALFLQGGGFLTFISRSDNTWDRQNDTVGRSTTPPVTLPIRCWSMVKKPTKRQCGFLTSALIACQDAQPYIPPGAVHPRRPQEVSG